MSEAAGAQAEAQQAPADVTPVSRLALRDGALALAALSLWAGADAWYGATGLAFAGLVSVLDGFLAGAALGAIAHEWGHFAGARWAGGIAPTTRLTSLFPLFVFDMGRSDPAAFRAMSVGGNVAHWLAVLVLVLGIPLDAPGRVALVSAAFGFAVFASTTELPVIRRAYAGASPAESFAGLTGDKLRRNGWVGAGAALLLFLVL
jgi:hypothetical protein